MRDSCLTGIVTYSKLNVKKMKVKLFIFLMTKSRGDGGGLTMTAAKNLPFLWRNAFICVSIRIEREFQNIFNKFCLFCGIFRAKFRTVI